jgi:hypothetical protein
LSNSYRRVLKQKNKLRKVGPSQKIKNKKRNKKRNSWRETYVEENKPCKIEMWK